MRTGWNIKPSGNENYFEIDIWTAESPIRRLRTGPGPTRPKILGSGRPIPNSGRYPVCGSREGPTNKISALHRVDLRSEVSFPNPIPLSDFLANSTEFHFTSIQMKVLI